MAKNPLVIYGDTIRRAKSRLYKLGTGPFVRFFPAPYYRYKVLKGFDRLSACADPAERKVAAVPNIVAEASNTCNLNCEICKTLVAKRPKGEMSIDLLKKVIGLKKGSTRKA